MTLSIMAFSITALKGLYATLSISEIQHNNAVPLCRVPRFIYGMLSFIMLSVVMLNVMVTG